MNLNSFVDLFNSPGGKQSEFGNASTPTVSGNSGIAGGGDLLDWIGRGADVYKNIKGASSVVPPETPSSTTPGIRTTLANATWLPYALVGVVLLIVAVIFFRR